jgi:hypothetical protein
MKQNEEIEQKKVEDQRRLKSNKQAVAASSSLAASQVDIMKKSTAVISKLEEDEESRELAGHLAIGENNSMDVKILKLAAELLEEINQFIESLWLAQREPAASEGTQNDTRSGNTQK